MKKPCSNPILLIHSAHTSEVKLANYFDGINQPWVGVSRFSDAAVQRRQRKFDMVVCDWELFQASQLDRAECECLGKLVNEAAPMIFVSASQSVSVNFKPVMGRSFYSVKAEESSDLFPIISELAQQVPVAASVAHSAAERFPAESDSSRPGSYLPAPHFSLGQTINPGLANSSVHSLY